jgi:hypothetical protein
VNGEVIGQARKWTRKRRRRKRREWDEIKTKASFKNHK